MNICGALNIAQPKKRTDNEEAAPNPFDFKMKAPALEMGPKTGQGLSLVCIRIRSDARQVAVDTVGNVTPVV